MVRFLHTSLTSDWLCLNTYFILLLVSWCMNSTMNLIECFNNHKEKFIKAATGEKLLIWKNISEQMAQNGYSYTARACDNKWRTLKNRYFKNRTRANRNKKVAWIYYNKIDSIIRGKYIICI